eukprot:TRINITY_DN21732_c0_g1_i1.p1 TRINITY_DN21732_c0_g1~~TRINITY_DN21732_c0_g1_i1.p1  ORF type:complete len:642 (-),score=108.30 TRINITY_DN21732_c0_g1_i1:7-1908(-)
MASLEKEVIPLSSLRDQYTKQWQTLLDSIRGTKAVIFDPTVRLLIQPISGKALLQEKNVKEVYELHASSVKDSHIDADIKAVVYCVRPRITTMKLVADHLRRIQAKGSRATAHVVMVPRNRLICEYTLRELGVLQDVVIQELALEIMPFAEDLLSMELEKSFRDLVLQGDHTCLHDVAMAVVRLENSFGIVPNVYCKGRLAGKVAQLIKKMHQSLGGDILGSVQPEIDSLFIIDREVDLITPFATQLTYEGLIDELWGIRGGVFTPPPGVDIPVRDGVKRQRVVLDATDKVFTEVRDRNYCFVGGLLNDRALAVKQFEADRHALRAGQLTDIRDYMRKMPEFQKEKEDLNMHVNVFLEMKKAVESSSFMRHLGMQQDVLAGEDLEKGVFDYLEECISKGEDETKILQLLCLASAVARGFKEKHLEFFRREVLQTYGAQELITMEHLERSGLFTKHESKAVFPTLNKLLRLYIEMPLEDASDIALMHAVKTMEDDRWCLRGYAPLSIRLVEHGVRSQTWKHIEPALGLLPGPTIEEHINRFEESDLASGAVGFTNSTAPKPRSRVVMVFFIGGVTYSEISALRMLGEKSFGSEEGQVHFIVCTTNITSGKHLLETLRDPIADPTREKSLAELHK